MACKLNNHNKIGVATSHQMAAVVRYGRTMQKYGLSSYPLDCFHRSLDRTELTMFIGLFLNSLFF